MNVKDILRRCSAVYTLRILAEHLQKAAFFSRHLANRAKRDNLKDMLPDLSIRVHAIEKGMSIGAVRIGFGVPKVLALIDDLQTWLKLGGSREFAVASCSVINNYIDFNIRGGGDK